MPTTHSTVSVLPACGEHGLAFAVTPDGLRLPVIDVGHPAFLIEESTLAEAASPERMRPPSRLASLLMTPLLRRSRLAGIVRAARGGYASGLGTYMLKLGPANLDPAWAGSMDRAIAGSLPCLSARLRLANCARLEADALAGMLEARGPGARVLFVNVAGGACPDTLNALMMVRRERPGLLEAAAVRILVLDVDEEGPAFATACLEALMSVGGILEGLDIAIERRRYDWNEPEAIAGILAEACRGMGSSPDAMLWASEGGLFEYSDQEIIARNIEAALAASTGAVAFIGSVGKAVGHEGAVNAATGVAARGIDLDTLRSATLESGWAIEEVLDCPLSHCMSLRPSRQAHAAGEVDGSMGRRR